MNPRVLATVHGDNIGLYRHALRGSTTAETVVFGTLIAMEATLLVELEELLGELGQLRAAQKALAGRTGSRPALRLISNGHKLQQHSAAPLRGSRESRRP